MTFKARKTIDGLDGTGLPIPIKESVISMEGKMATEGFGSSKNYG